MKFLDNFNLKYTYTDDLYIEPVENIDKLLFMIEPGDLMISRCGNKFKYIATKNSANSARIRGKSLENKNSWEKNEICEWDINGYYSSIDNSHTIAFVIKRKDHPEYFL